MANIFNKINFNPASGQTLREAFDTIDENFSRIGGTSLLRGEDGTDWDAEVVDWRAASGPEWEHFTDAVLGVMYGTDVPVGADLDAAKNSIPREVTVMRSEEEILLTPTCVADYKYSAPEGTNAAWSSEDDKSCVVSGLYDIRKGAWKMIKGESIMPRIYCDADGAAYWMFGQYKTNIRANGVPGPAGEGDRILVARGELSVIDGVRGVIIRKIWDAAAGDNRFVDISEASESFVPRIGTWAYAFAIDETATPESAVTDVFMGPIDTKELVGGDIVYFVGYDAAQSIGTLVGQFSLKRALMETGRKDEDEGADALPFLFLNCGFEDEKEGAWRNTGSWRFIPTHDKGTVRDTLTVEHSGAPVTNDSYTEEDEFKAVGADMRINGVDAIYKECTFEPIYQKDPDLYANASAVYKNVIEQQNKDILSGLHEKEKVPFKSDLQLGAQVNRKFSDVVYDSVICLNTFNDAAGAPGDVDASPENPISYTPYSSVGEITSPTSPAVISKCPETVNRDMIEFLLSVIRPIGAISRYKTDGVTNTTVQSIFHPMDIDVINVVLRDILYGLGLNKKQYKGICDVKKSLYERLELCENLNIQTLLSKNLDYTLHRAYDEIPVGNTITIPRAYIYEIQNGDSNVVFSYEERAGWANSTVYSDNKNLLSIEFNIYNAKLNSYSDSNLSDRSFVVFNKIYEEWRSKEEYKNAGLQEWFTANPEERFNIMLWGDKDGNLKSAFMDGVWKDFLFEINRYSNKKMFQCDKVNFYEIVIGDTPHITPRYHYKVMLFDTIWISEKNVEAYNPSSEFGNTGILDMEPVVFKKLQSVYDKL